VLKVRGSFTDAGAHATAIDPAMRAALAQFLAYLAPANIEARVRDRNGSPSDPAAVWERYRDVYMTLLHATGQELPHLFTEALAQAYGRELDNQSIETFKPLRD
jgi:predicted component of type VI protein secretion system